MVNYGARRAIDADIRNFRLLFDEKNSLSAFAFHAIVGKIGLAVQLEMICIKEADKLIDRLFKEYGKL